MALLLPVIRIFLFASLLVIVASLDLSVVTNRTVAVTFKTVKPGRCFLPRLEDAAAPEGVNRFFDCPDWWGFNVPTTKTVWSVREPIKGAKVTVGTQTSR